jgi:hypothetical protein
MRAYLLPLLFLPLMASAGWQSALEDRSGLQLHGFLDGRAGTRLADDPYNDDLSIADLRLQLDLLHDRDLAIWQLRLDVLGDSVNHDDLDLERGQGWLDLREANVSLPLGDSLEIKLGRQIITWGTGQMLFLNDLFPKDWESFFIGRDTEYLKAPSDAAIASWYLGETTLDIVVTPRFDADRFIRGERLSYYGPGGPTAARVETNARDDWGRDAETALRLNRMLGAYEVALYGYHGFWKSPAGFDTVNGRATHPRLAAYGASLRGPLGSGIANAEVAYYDSLQDQHGDDPSIDNAEARILLGYQQEVASETNLGLQWYLEWLQDYDAYRASLPVGMPQRDQYRHVLTVDLSRQLLNQNLRVGLFAYFSPTDRDSYLRPNLLYKLSDNWHLSAGANLFFGKSPHTFFGQFEDNSNAYVSLRRYF